MELVGRRSKPAAATVGDRLLFAGGKNDSEASSYVDFYDKSFTRTYANLETARWGLAGVGVGGHAIFAGGYRSTANLTNAVEVYDSSMTRSTITALSVARIDLSSAKVGDYAIFAGGSGSSGAVNTVDVYNKSLTRSSPASALAYARTYMAAASLAGYAMFVGGYNSSYRSEVDVYDESLTKVPADKLDPARYDVMSATIGDYAIFAGGSYESSDVNVYQLS
jgi:hypothetical protein